MPTPFYHLALAEALLADDKLPTDTRQLLAAQRPAFLFGHTAPDVQTVSGQLREATHFFSIPLHDPTPAHTAMFAQHRQLAHAAALPPAQRAFVAGYICHLLLDQMWIRKILQPIFGLEATWETFRERLFIHNVMRVYLDRQDIDRLPPDEAACLMEATPEGWLPFVADAYLREWRDFIARQLEPGAPSRTVEVFAARMGRHVAEFEDLLGAPDELQRRLWAHMPASALQAFRNHALVKSTELMQSYLGRQR